MTAVLTIAQVANVVAREWGVTVLDLKSPRRPEPLATARHVAMRLAYRLTGASSGGIGRWFGQRDHTTVLSAIKRLGGRLEWDGDLAVTVAGLELGLRALAQADATGRIAQIDALAVGRRLAGAPDRDIMAATTQEIAALARRVVEAQHALLDAARLVRGLANPKILRDEPALAARAARLAAGLEALGVLEIPTEKEAI